MTRAEAAGIGALVDESVAGIKRDVDAGLLTAAEGAELIAIFGEVGDEADSFAEGADA